MVFNSLHAIAPLSSAPWSNNPSVPPVCPEPIYSLNLRVQCQPLLGKRFLNLISHFCRLFSHRGLSFCRFINLFASSLPNHLWVVLCVLIGRAFPQRGRDSDLLLGASGHPNQDPFQPPQGVYLEAGVPGSVSTVQYPYKDATTAGSWPLGTLPLLAACWPGHSAPAALAPPSHLSSQPLRPRTPSQS